MNSLIETELLHYIRLYRAGDLSWRGRIEQLGAGITHSVDEDGEVRIITRPVAHSVAAIYLAFLETESTES